MPSRRAVVAAVGAIFAVVVASGSPLHSGRFVPVVEQVAALKCPQSLGTLDGTGHCIGLTPLGAAMVDGPGADIFVQCNAQMAPPQGNRFIYRYPFKSIDPTTGTPIFASPISMNTTGVFPAPISNLSLATLRPKTVWRGVDGMYHANYGFVLLQTFCCMPLSAPLLADRNCRTRASRRLHRVLQRCTHTRTHTHAAVNSCGDARPLMQAGSDLQRLHRIICTCSRCVRMEGRGATSRRCTTPDPLSGLVLRRRLSHRRSMVAGPSSAQCQPG
jgi:hypothetical protein